MTSPTDLRKLADDIDGRTIDSEYRAAANALRQAANEIERLYIEVEVARRVVEAVKAEEAALEAWAVEQQAIEKEIGALRATLEAEEAELPCFPSDKEVGRVGHICRIDLHGNLVLERSLELGPAAALDLGRWLVEYFAPPKKAGK